MVQLFGSPLASPAIKKKTQNPRSLSGVGLNPSNKLQIFNIFNIFDIFYLNMVTIIRIIFFQVNFGLLMNLSL